jgi:type III pantothenate kinase
MLLVIDVGNTRVKLFVYEHDVLRTTEVLLHDNFFENFLIFFKKNNLITHSILSSVANLDQRVINFLQIYTQLTMISYQSKLPFINKYATPATLGVDRIVLAAGAVLNYPDQNRLIIDAGTCITYDFVTDENEYIGGAISPGLKMRYDALAHFTAKLPLLSFNEPDFLIGNSTAESIHSGVFNGFVNEINGFITEYEKQFTNLAVILTGGDCNLLSTKIKSSIFANTNFLTESLKDLHDYISKN